MFAVGVMSEPLASWSQQGGGGDGGGGGGDAAAAEVDVAVELAIRAAALLNEIHLLP